MKDLYSENYGSKNLKMMQSCSIFLGLEVIFWKYPYQLQQVIDLIQSVSKYPWLFFFFYKIITNNPKNYMDPQKTLNCQSNIEKKEWSWRCHASWLQPISQTYGHQNRHKYCYKNRHIGQWNRIKNSERTQYTSGQVIYEKGGKNIQWRKDSLFNKLC